MLLITLNSKFCHSKIVKILIHSVVDLQFKYYIFIHNNSLKITHYFSIFMTKIMNRP